MTRKLHGQAYPLAEITEQDIGAMFGLFQTYFDNTTRDIFIRDLSSKNWVILLRETETGVLQGFSSLAFYQTTVNDRQVSVVYSGDTIIHRDYWGTPELPKTWIKTVLHVGEQFPKPLYWLLISSGYKTYRFLSVFYKVFYPHYDQPTPPHIRQLMDCLAGERFGSDYLPELGIVRFSVGATPLKQGVAEPPPSRTTDPHIDFFLQRNPGHADGDELVCLTVIDPANFTAAGRRMAR